ncbi:MAG: TonB-dependent receptor [Telluria sp.]
MLFKQKAGAAAVGIALALMAGLAYGQETAQKADDKKKDDAPANKVVITGSNLRRISVETASPVQVITRDEMVRAGQTSLTEVLKTISSNIGGVNENRTDGFTAGASGLNLRGFGSQATLLLINGRRLAAYAQPEFQTTFVDINSVPVGAVERIEILKDGASAIYGSEAMAGVVNIILRESYTGLETEASLGRSSRHDGQTKRGSLSFGHGNLASDHYNAYATIDVRDRDPMYISRRPDYIGTENLAPWGYRDVRSIYSYPGNIYWTDKATGKFVSRPISGAACPADHTVPGTVPFGTNAAPGSTACVYDQYKDGDYNSAGRTKRVGLTSRATFQLNADTTLWTELMFNRNDATVTGLYNWLAAQNGQPTGALPITSPMYPRDLIGPDGKTLAGGNKSVRVRALLADFGGMGQHNVTDFSRFLVGSKGSLGSWDWETAYLYTGSTVTSHATGALLETPFVDAWNAGQINLGNMAGSPLLGSVKTDATDHFKSYIQQVDAKLTGEAYRLPAGAINVALGLEARRESLTTEPDPQSVAGEIYHIAQSPPGLHNSRDVRSVYFEASVPLTRTLEASLAGRYDHYSDYGNSKTPKAGLKWTVMPSLVLRATYAEGFRAPTLVENSTDVRHAYLSYTDPARCNDQFKEGCQWSSAYDSGANPALGPEKGKSFTWGAVWQPSSMFSGSLDVYRILRTNEIGTYDLSKVLKDPARYANDPAVQVTRDPLTDADRAAGATAGEITFVKLLLTNVASSEIRGADLNLRAKFNMGEWGTYEPNLDLGYILSYKYRPSVGDLPVEYATTRGLPRVNATLYNAWKRNNWELSADVVYQGRMSGQDDYTVDCSFATEGFPALCDHVASYTTVNLGGSYKGLFGMRDLKLSFAMQNAFDRMPPFTPYSGLGYYLPLHNPMGRYFQATVSYKFK